MSKPDRFDSVVTEAPPGVEAAPVRAAKATAEVTLDGDELVQISIKPSAWFIPLVSLKWLLAMGLLGAALLVAARGGWSREGFIAFQVAMCVAALRVAIATLQWASRLYVLTNRRIMRFAGFVSVHVAECPLSRISKADLSIAGYQRPLRLGSITMLPTGERAAPIVWDHLAHPSEIHERLVRAIRKAQSRD